MKERASRRERLRELDLDPPYASVYRIQSDGVVII